MVLPAYTTPTELAAHLGVNERTLRAKAREVGACRIIGNKMFHTDGDVNLLLEAMRPCPSNYTGAAKSGITGAPLPAGSYETLRAQRTKQSPKGSRTKQPPANGGVISMAQRRR